MSKVDSVRPAVAQEKEQHPIDLEGVTKEKADARRRAAINIYTREKAYVC